MNDNQEIPEDSKCFFCLKPIVTYKRLLLNIQCKDAIVVVAVAVCEDDIDYIKKNPDVSVALLQSRLQTIVKENEAEE